MRIVDDLDELVRRARRPATAARSSPSACTTACTSVTTRCCASCASWPTRATSPRCASPSTATRPRSCGPSRRPSSSPRPSRSSSCSTPPATSTSRSCCTSTRPAARSRPRTSCARCSPTPRTPRLVVVGADFHFGKGRGGDVALLQRMGAELGFEVLGVGLEAAPPVRAGRHHLLVDPHPRAARRGRRRPAAAELLGRPHEVRGVVVEGDRRGRELGLSHRQRRGPEPLLPPGRRHLRGHVRRRRRRRAHDRDLARPPPDVLRVGRLVPARGLRPRLRRRPLRPGGQGAVRRAPARRAEVRLGRRPGRADRAATSRPPGRCSRSARPGAPEAVSPARLDATGRAALW